MVEQAEKDLKRVSEVDKAFEAFRSIRLPHDQQWYINKAMFRGQHYVTWSELDQRLVPVPTLPGRIRLAINRVMPKVRARMAKFNKDIRVPLAVPSTRDVKDKLNARATSLALEYQWRRCSLPAKYGEALFNSAITGHGYFWYHWDANVVRRTMMPGQEGKPELVEAMLGDVSIEVPSTYEILVEDPGIAFIGNQPRIMRVRVMAVEDIEARWESEVPSEGIDDNEALRYAHRVAALTSTGAGGFSSLEDTGQDGQDDPKKKRLLLKELFEKPCPSYPKGRYTATAAGVLLDDRDELPLNFHNLPNPYPCTDFTDTVQAGQYWITTILEQLIPLQREYNLLRSKLAEHFRLMVHGKILVARQHQLQEGVWTEEAGEIVEYVAIPNIPPPTPWAPPQISADVWNGIGMIPKEMDDVSLLFPEAAGAAGQSSSGFQTNLLQEATDAVHQPDLDNHRRCFEEVGQKIRRMMKDGWNTPSFISISGSSMISEALEFSSSNIDEYADIRIEAASGLPTLKAARVQMISELWTAGLLGSPDDPEAARRARKMLEFGSLEDQFDVDKQDEEAARLENTLTEEGRPVEDAMFFENHDLHYRLHTDQLKSASGKQWEPELRTALLRHALTHVVFINPQSAAQLAQQYGFTDLLEKPEIQAVMQQAQQGQLPPQAPSPDVAGPPGSAPTAPPVQ